MGNWLSDTFGLVVVLFVPAVVWTTLLVGLYQLVREEIRQVHIPPRLESYSQQLG